MQVVGSPPPAAWRGREALRSPLYGVRLLFPFARPPVSFSPGIFIGGCRNYLWAVSGKRFSTNGPTLSPTPLCCGHPSDVLRCLQFTVSMFFGAWLFRSRLFPTFPLALSPPPSGLSATPPPFPFPCLVLEFGAAPLFHSGTVFFS